MNSGFGSFKTVDVRCEIFEVFLLFSNSNRENSQVSSVTENCKTRNPTARSEQKATLISPRHFPFPSPACTFR